MEIVTRDSPATGRRGRGLGGLAQFQICSRSLCSSGAQAGLMLVVCCGEGDSLSEWQFAQVTSGNG